MPSSSSHPREKLVVVGLGWVGQANALALSISGYDVYYFDVAKPQFRYADKYPTQYAALKPLPKILEVDGPHTWYIVCVGDRVLPSGEQDITPIRKALASLKDAQGGVILRSTILPSSLASLDFDYYVPEFLHEKKAVEESLSMHYFIVGKKQGSSAEWPGFFDLWERGAAKVFRGTPEEASYIKYLSNTWNSLRIAFVNEFGNAMALPDSPEKMAGNERVIDFFFERKGYLRYGRSYNGHCLPKDTHAFFTDHQRQGRDMSLLEGTHKSNLAHRAIEEQNPHLPEWFSEWSRPVISGRAALSALRESAVRKTKKIFRRTLAASSGASTAHSGPKK